MIDRCDSLRNLLTASVAKALSCLQELEIEECSFLERVVIEEELRIQVSDQAKVILFPQLRAIKLSKLPQLQNFYSGNLTLEFPSLEELSVIECPNLQTFSSGKVLKPQNTRVTAYYSREGEGDRVQQNLFKTEVRSK